MTLSRSNETSLISYLNVFSILASAIFALSYNTAAQAADNQLWYPEVSKPQPRTPTRDTSKNKMKAPQVAASTVKEPTHIKFGFGLGVGFPDMVPITGYMKFGHVFALRLFFSPSIPFPIEVDLPDDQIKTSSNSPLVVKTPAMTINFNAVYGPQYGIEGYVFPFAGSFFMGGGISYRSLAISGRAESNVSASDLNGTVTMQSFTRLAVEASAKTAQYVLRGVVGWHWEMLDDAFINLFLGYTTPYSAGSNVSISGELHGSNQPTTDALNNATETLRATKAAELETQARKSMRPAEKLSLPLLGFEVGYFL